MNRIKKEVIIVGGGTSGAVIANRLSRLFNVTVFECSKKWSLPYIYRIPLSIGYLFSKKTDYIKNIKIKFNSNRWIPFFVSNVLGGASVINGCVHVIGSRVRWERLLKRFQLKYSDFDASYGYLYSRKFLKKKVRITEACERTLDRLFFQELERVGIKRGDIEWADSPATGSVFNTVGHIFRSSVMSLNPFNKSALKMGFRVTNLVVDDDLKVVGVFDGHDVFLADIVILSAGVIGTNILLQNKALKLSDNSFVELNIPAGHNIKDHTNLRVNVESKIPFGSLNEINSSWSNKAYVFLRHIFGSRTVMMGTGATSAAHLDLDSNGEVDTRINLLNFSETGRMGSDGKLFSSTAPGFSISITQINPVSHGTLETRNDESILDPGYISDEYDVDHLKAALSFVVEILESCGFSKIVKEIAELDQIKSNPVEYIVNNCYSGYHLIGGCANLVDHDFKISELGELYVCDASVLDEYVSSNIHSTILILADMFSQKLINKFEF